MIGLELDFMEWGERKAKVSSGCLAYGVPTKGIRRFGGTGFRIN